MGGDDTPFLARVWDEITFLPVWIGFRLISVAARVHPDARDVLRAMWDAGLDVRDPRSSSAKRGSADQ